MSGLFNRINALSFVRRWNFHPHVRSETVLEHSASVGMMAYLIAIETGIPKTECADIGMKALFHDLEESSTGDIPYLVKRFLGNPVTLVNQARLECIEALVPSEAQKALSEALAGITEHKHRIIKLADLLDALRFCDLQASLGCGTLRQIRAELVGACVKLVGTDGDLYRSVLIVAGIDLHFEHKAEVVDSLCHL